jgi:hypothetical protein
LICQASGHVTGRLFRSGPAAIERCVHSGFCRRSLQPLEDAGFAADQAKELDVPTDDQTDAFDVFLWRRATFFGPVRLERVRLHPDRLIYREAGQDVEIRLDAIVGVNLRMLSQINASRVCRISLADGTLLQVRDLGANGKSTARNTADYARFVRVLHMYLASSDRPMPDLTIGVSEARYRSGHVVIWLLGALLLLGTLVALVGQNALIALSLVSVAGTFLASIKGVAGLQPGRYQADKLPAEHVQSAEIAAVA